MSMAVVRKYNLFRIYNTSQTQTNENNTLHNKIHYRLNVTRIRETTQTIN